MSLYVRTDIHYILMDFYLLHNILTFIYYIIFYFYAKTALDERRMKLQVLDCPGLER